MYDLIERNFQDTYEALAESWAIEEDDEKERSILWQVIDLLQDAQKSKKRVCIHEWMKSAILAEKRNFVFPSEAGSEEDFRAFLD
jgi:hypothetical protein